MRAGKYSYIVEYPENTFYFHNCVVHYRTENVPLKFAMPEGAGSEVAPQAAFDKQSSVFKTWTEPGPEKLQDAIQHDLRSIRFAAFLPASELKAMERFITEHFGEL